MAAMYLSATGATGSRRPCGAMPAKGGFLKFASYKTGNIREHFVKASPIRSDFRHPEPCSPRPQYRLRGGRGHAKGAGTAQPRIERPQLRPAMNAARAAFPGVGPFRRERVVWVVAPNEGVSGQLMENVLTHLLDKRSDQDLWRSLTANGQYCDRTWSANNSSRSTRPEDLG